ncbi:MAG: alpha-galactosidase [Bacteroidota bacterium]|nr:alpha-galactosidase [Bacteroidota bacterium]MDP4211853.1 alpha-galactosidase [Bacteroidota bacterium]MDP4250939.1 alpha-galactosidase [Bacteroidota bacterium]
MKPAIILLSLLFVHLFTSAQPFASWKGNQLILDNGVVRRELVLEENKIITRSLKLKGDDLNFDTGESGEFSFALNDENYDGSSGWQLASMKPGKDDQHGDGVVVNLNGTGNLKGIGLAITYLLYPDLPVIRKQIQISNQTAKEIKLESVDVEKLRLGFSYVESVVYTNYGRQKHLGTYIGNWDDPLLAIHSYSNNAGILLGNEAPGVLKRIDYATLGDNADIGLTHSNDLYPFRKYIRPGESWTSPRVFLIPYIKSSNPWRAMNNELSSFERKYMGLRIFETSNRPEFMYNNYRPFGSDISDTLLISLAKAAASSGIRQFEVDCGWHTTAGNIGKKIEWIDNTGDWIIDKIKFPNGLKPVFDTIRRLGMEPGLWISVGSAASASAVFKQHPEWAVQDEQGHPADLHSTYENDLHTMCFGTGWKNYIQAKILELVKDLGLRFIKVDLTVVTSAYFNEINKSGCYAKNHPDHKDREESFWVIYNNLFNLFDALHKQAPDLYIDCTFETEGKLQLIDYAFLEHAEGNWLTNIGEPFPIGAYRVRDLTWWKSPAVPASSLIIGNLTMDNPDFVNELKTLIGSFPIVLGDPRELSAKKRAEIKRWGDWISAVKHKYQYDLYRQDLPGFAEPVEGGWDGWSRINTDTKKGGIIGIFKQGSLDNTRIVSVPGLEYNRQYQIKLAPNQTPVISMSGKDLAEKGFPVKMDQPYDGKLYEIEMITPYSPLRKPADH